MRIRFWFILVTVLALLSCKDGGKPAPEGRLPILGARQTGPNGDTIYQTIPGFSFLNQDSVFISQDSLDGKIYVADFFFTTCPTICPIMTKNMVDVYEAFKGNPRVKIYSHSIDPRNDSVPVLKAYSDALGVTSGTWHMVTGDKMEIFAMAKAYMVSALEDPTAPGGLVHSGAFILIDPDRRIRGYYDGTKPEEVKELIADIQRLMNEYFPG